MVGNRIFLIIGTAVKDILLKEEKDSLIFLMRDNNIKPKEGLNLGYTVLDIKVKD